MEPPVTPPAVPVQPQVQPPLPAVPPTPPVPVPAVAPQVPAPAKADATQEPAPLTGDQVIFIDDKKGGQTPATLGAMAEAFRNQPDPESQKKFDLYVKATEGNDPAAMQELLALNYPQAVPQVDPTAPPESSAQVQELQTKFDNLQSQVDSKFTPMFNQLTTHQETTAIAQVLQQQAEHFPLASKHPQAAQLIQQKRRQIIDLVRTQKNLDLTTMDSQVQARLLQKSFQEVENGFKETLTALGVQVPQAPVNQGPMSVDDQTPQQAIDGDSLKAPRFQMDANGQYVDTSSGQPVPQAAGQLPVAPVQPLPAGGSPGVTPAPPSGPFSVDQMKERARARLGDLSGVG